MQSQNEIIENIVTILSKEKNINKIFFLAEDPKENTPYNIALIIFEEDSPDYFISQFHYEALLKNISGNITFNILPVNSNKAEVSLVKRLEDALCIYQKKETA